MENERVKGFYWIQDANGSWQVAKWHKDKVHRWRWLLIGELKPFSDSDFMQINENKIDRRDFKQTNNINTDEMQSM